MGETVASLPSIPTHTPTITHSETPGRKHLAHQVRHRPRLEGRGDGGVGGGYFMGQPSQTKERECPPAGGQRPLPAETVTMHAMCLLFSCREVLALGKVAPAAKDKTISAECGAEYASCPEDVCLLLM